MTAKLDDGEQLTITILSTKKSYVFTARADGSGDIDSNKDIDGQLGDIISELTTNPDFTSNFDAWRLYDTNFNLVIEPNTAADPASDFTAVISRTGKVSEVHTDTEPVVSTWHDVSTAKNVQGAAVTTGFPASTTLDLSQLKTSIEDGATLTIGKDTYTFALNAPIKYKGDNVIDLTKFKPIDDRSIDEAGRQLSGKANQVFTLGFDPASKKLSIRETVGQTVYTLKELGTVTAFKAQIYMNKADPDGMSFKLTLQIGDTSEEFDQLTVVIKPCNTGALGIGGIDISTQDRAALATDKAKKAINYVSSVRGDLGAVQNRLEHTAQNLSVTAENMQDAESTIRDTDVAEEMMSYVKNNILVQSAQAMLAQANQQPQSVLQLLN